MYKSLNFSVSIKLYCYYYNYAYQTHTQMRRIPLLLLFEACDFIMFKDGFIFNLNIVLNLNPQLLFSFYGK